jgi:hypothetical protein
MIRALYSAATGMDVQKRISMLSRIISPMSIQMVLKRVGRIFRISYTIRSDSREPSRKQAIRCRRALK